MKSSNSASEYQRIESIEKKVIKNYDNIWDLISRENAFSIWKERKVLDKNNVIQQIRL